MKSLDANSLEDGRTRTLEEIGDYYGVTRERVRQLEKKAMIKIKARRELLEPFLEIYRWEADA